MSEIFDTKTLENHVLSLYTRAVPVMNDDGISMPLNTFFRKNTPNDIQGEFCFADEDGYHYRVLERDILYHDDITISLSEITYWAIKGAISDAAAIYEAKNRILGQDFRRIMFSKELQYFNAVSPEYEQRDRVEINTILEKFPFQDE